jgi:2-C-methyl-D-erythritol 2,4-cyclodiphosphate synthase
MRVGHGYDVHRLAKDQPLVLGGVKIPSEKGLSGWSDADVLTHAIMDALLGAAALGDIGKFFPPGEPQYKGISSIILLRQVNNLLQKAGWKPGNIDATIVAEQPRLAPYITEMRRKLAEALGTEIDDISIKATTSEQMGFVGREEGMVAWAVALILKR